MYDRNRLMTRVPRKGDAYQVPLRSYYEWDAMQLRLGARAFRMIPGSSNTQHARDRREVVEMLRRARLDPSATPHRIIP